MKNAIIYFLVSTIFILISCSSPTDPGENDISIIHLDGKLLISNNSNQTIYLFTVERGIAASINWVPHFNDPKILINSSITIDYSEI